MKSSIAFIVLTSMLCFACERCYECTADVPVFVNGMPAGTVGTTQEICESSVKARSEAEAYENEGYTCTLK